MSVDWPEITTLVIVLLVARPPESNSPLTTQCGMNSLPTATAKVFAVPSNADFSGSAEKRLMSAPALPWMKMDCAEALDAIAMIAITSACFGAIHLHPG